MNKNKTLGILIALIIAASVGMFLFGQEVLGQEAVVVEMKVNADPVMSSPPSDVSVSIAYVRAYRSRVSASEFRRQCRAVETSGNKLAAFPGAIVTFVKNVTIYDNSTGEILYQHILNFTNIADRNVTCYLPKEGIEPETVLKIVISIWIRIELPTSPLPPAPQTIERSITKVVYATVEG